MSRASSEMTERSRGSEVKGPSVARENTARSDRRVSSDRKFTPFSVTRSDRLGPPIFFRNRFPAARQTSDTSCAILDRSDSRERRRNARVILLSIEAAPGRNWLQFTIKINALPLVDSGRTQRGGTNAG